MEEGRAAGTWEGAFGIGGPRLQGAWVLWSNQPGGGRQDLDVASAGDMGEHARA